MSALPLVGKFRSYKTVFNLAVLMTLSFIGNYLNLPFMADYRLVFGSVATLIVVRVYGTGWGALAAVVSGSYCYFYLNIPSSVFLYVFEAVFVGKYLKNKNDNLLFANGIYWVLIGMPLGWLINYLVMDFSSADALVGVLKYGINGFFNALIACIILNQSIFRRWLFSFNSKPFFSLYHLIFTLMVAMVLFPTLLFMILDNDRAQKQINTQVNAVIEERTGDISLHLATWINYRLEVLKHLADLVSKTDLKPSDYLQNVTETLEASVPDFARVHVDNAQGKSVAFSPIRDEKGNLNIGLDFSERDYYKALKNNRKPYISDLMIGRVGDIGSIIILGVPILKDNNFEGYVVGAIDLKYLDRVLRMNTVREGTSVTVVDGNGLVIASTREDLNKMDKFKENNLGMHFSKKDIKITDNLPWKMIVEVDMEPYLNQLRIHNIQNMLFMLAFCIAAFIFSNIFTSRLVRTIEGINTVTTNLPEKILDRERITWPSSQFQEFNYLIANFRSMAESLQQNFNAIWEEKERTQITLHSIGDAVITADSLGNVEFLNPAAVNLTGWKNDEARGLPINKVFPIYDEATGTPAENPVEKCLKEGRIVELSNSTVLINRDGNRFIIEDSASPIRNREGHIIGCIMVFHDVTEKRSMIKQLIHQAYHDSLTDLPNRVLFNDRLTVALAQARRNKLNLAVMFVDLDKFKQINDKHGHAVGDQLLQEVARRLRSSLRETDTVARLGGDEFIVLINGISNVNQATEVANKILRLFERPWVIGGYQMMVTASIGIALYPDNGDNAEVLMKRADMAMYKAKALGRNFYRLYSEIDLNDQNFSD